LNCFCPQGVCFILSGFPALWNAEPIPLGSTEAEPIPLGSTEKIKKSNTLCPLRLERAWERAVNKICVHLRTFACPVGSANRTGAVK